MSSLAKFVRLASVDSGHQTMSASVCAQFLDKCVKMLALASRQTANASRFFNSGSNGLQIPVLGFEDRP